MSTDGHDEHGARTDRSGPISGPEQDDRRSLASRQRRLLAVLLTALAVVPLVWVDGERADATVHSQVVQDAPEAPSIPLHMNSRVEHWLAEFSTSRSEEFYHLLVKQGAFEDLIRGELRKRGMPEDLLYLAMIESGLSPIAESRVSAVGLWQFMGPTAMQYGLRVDPYIDERRDPIRATDAALDYLEYLHARFDSWYLAAAAYNAGPGRVERILHRHADGRTGDEELYWEVLLHLPRETRDYVPRLVAMTILASEAELHGIEIPKSPAYEFDKVFVPGETALSTVAESLDVEIEVLSELNPHLIRGVTPPGELYGVRVPKGGASTVLASLGQRSIGSRAD